MLVKSLIYVPLILQNKPIGVLGVTNHIKETSFDSNDTRALSALGGYATIAINNANMYNTLVHERNLLGTVVEQIENPVIVVDEDFRLSVLNAAARNALNTSEEEAMGRPIMDLIHDTELVQLVTDSANNGYHSEGDIKLDNGRSYRARVSLVDGGGRFMTLRPVE